MIFIVLSTGYTVALFVLGSSLVAYIKLSCVISNVFYSLQFLVNHQEFESCENDKHSTVATSFGKNLPRPKQCTCMLASVASRMW